MVFFAAALAMVFCMAGIALPRDAAF